MISQSNFVISEAEYSTVRLQSEAKDAAKAIFELTFFVTRWKTVVM